MLPVKKTLMTGVGILGVSMRELLGGTLTSSQKMHTEKRAAKYGVEWGNNIPIACEHKS